MTRLASLRLWTRPRGYDGRSRFRRRSPNLFTVVCFLAQLFVASSACLLSVRTVHADSAAVLPKGRASFGLDYLYYFPATKRFDPNGNAVDIASGINGRSLDSTIFPQLAVLNPFVPGGDASIGDAFVTFKYRYDVLDYGFLYGITDRLTAGIDIPYYWGRNDVRASLNSGPGSSANVGLRVGSPVGPCAAPILPLTCPNSRPFTTEDVQQLLGPGLPGIPGFGYKPVENFSANGFGDVSVAAKYQYLRTQDWELAVTGGVRFPTGRADDPDNLSDVFWSSGAYALLFRSHVDYAISNLWREVSARPADSAKVLGAGDLILDFTFRYDLVLPDTTTLRGATPEDPISNVRDRVHRDLGDRFEFEVSALYYPPILRGLSLSALYKYGFKLKDHLYGPAGFPNQAQEQDTDSTEQLYIVRANYSTLPLYLEKRFPIPLLISIYYRDRFAGSGPQVVGSPSQVLKTRYLGFGLQILF